METAFQQISGACLDQDKLHINEKDDYVFCSVERELQGGTNANVGAKGQDGVITRPWSMQGFLEDVGSETAVFPRSSGPFDLYIRAHPSTQLHSLNMQCENAMGISQQFKAVHIQIITAHRLSCLLVFSHHAAPASSTETSNSDNNDAQLGAFAPNLIHSNIGTIHGSLFSNNQLNQIHHHHHHHPQADDDADYAKIKVRDIILETELGSHNFHHDLQSDGTLVEVGRIRKYTGRLFQQPHGSMLIHKY
ncbi:hypothetical protein C8J56DRAFT_1024152, partial [Mycena floridula]